MRTNVVGTRIFVLLLVAAALMPIQATAQTQTNSQAPTPLDAALDAQVTQTEGNFSVIWITDTQYLTEKYPTYYDSLCRWIVKNQEKYNAKMVIHTGDLVQTEGNLTQWEYANHSMSLLLDAGIPYCWDAGNHDFNQTCWVGNQYAAFDPENFATQPYWIGSNGDGRSTAVHFTVDDHDFLIVNLEYLADNDALDWANELLDAYPQSHAIAATHFYLNRTGNYENWAENFRQTVLATHSNVFLTLSAHVHPLANSGLRNQVGDRHELLFNRQDKDNYIGAASLRILTFNIEEQFVDVKTFYIYANTFIVDEYNQFTLQTNFRNDLAPEEEAAIPEIPNAAVLVLLIAGVTAALFVAKPKLKQKPSSSAAV
ncbi:MAG: metallophosphoesterase [Candidatus Bathyarchaeota archaeon]|nr:metallophosphoesterase [Candidatus Bathyarchaeota archaeon]